MPVVFDSTYGLRVSCKAEDAAPDDPNLELDALDCELKRLGVGATAETFEMADFTVDGDFVYTLNEDLIVGDWEAKVRCQIGDLVRSKALTFSVRL